MILSREWVALQTLLRLADQESSLKVTFNIIVTNCENRVAFVPITQT